MIVYIDCGPAKLSLTKLADEDRDGSINICTSQFQIIYVSIYSMIPVDPGSESLFLSPINHG
jgi:hypothetical protein